MQIAYKDWNIEAMTGYRPITTYYMDFSIAEKFKNGVKDTFERVMKQFKENGGLGYKYLTEFVMALNWKIWEHYGSNDQLARLYNELWEKAAGFAETNLKGDELAYYYRVTD